MGQIEIDWKIRNPRMTSHHAATFIRKIRNTDPVPVFTQSANRLLIGRPGISKNQPSFIGKIREADPWKSWKIKDFQASDITCEYEIRATPKRGVRGSNPPGDARQRRKCSGFD